MAKQFVTFPKGDPRVRLPKLRRAMYQGALDAMETAAEFCAASARQNLTDGGKIDRGMLRGSIETKVFAFSDRIVARVVVGAPWARWVEYGRLGKVTSPKGTDPNLSAKAAWPPVPAIREWVQRHAQILEIFGRTKSGRARGAPRDTGPLLDTNGNLRKTRAQSRIDSVAFLIGRAIYRRGIAPFPFLGPAVQHTEMQFKGILKRAMAAARKRA